MSDKKDYIVIVHSYRVGQTFPLFMGGAQGTYDEIIAFAIQSLTAAGRIQKGEVVYAQINAITEPMARFLATGQREQQAAIFTNGFRTLLTYCMINYVKVVKEPFALLYALDSLQELDSSFIEFCRTNLDLLEDVKAICDQFMSGIAEKLRAQN